MQKINVFKAIHNEITKSIFSTPVVSNYYAPPEKTKQEQNTTKKPISRRGVALAIIFCILGVIGASLPLSHALSDALLPLLFLLASLLFSDMAMAHSYNIGLIACIILDSIFL